MIILAALLRGWTPSFDKVLEILESCNHKIDLVRLGEHLFKAPPIPERLSLLLEYTSDDEIAAFDAQVGNPLCLLIEGCLHELTQLEQIFESTMESYPRRKRFRDCMKVLLDRCSWTRVFLLEALDKLATYDDHRSNSNNNANGFAANAYGNNFSNERLDNASLCADVRQMLVERLASTNRQRVGDVAIGFAALQLPTLCIVEIANRTCEWVEPPMWLSWASAKIVHDHV